MRKLTATFCLTFALLLVSAGVSESSNLRTCLSGNYPSLCKHHLLTPEQTRQVDTAERRENYRTCSSGNYPSLCKRHLLTPEQTRQVDTAERDVPKFPGTSYPSSGSSACAENGSCYGDISKNTGRSKTVRVRGYYRKDGTYVRGHYRSKKR